MVKVPYIEASIDESIKIPPEQRKWISQDRAKHSKKYPPKHKMLSPFYTQWLLSSPEVTSKRIKEGAEDIVLKFANRLASQCSTEETTKLDLPRFLAVPDFNIDFLLDFKSTYLMEVLKGIDVRRLRICSKCKHVFWAYRLNQEYCGKDCQNNAKRSRSYHRNKKKGDEK
jgi:hypothetical protein